MHFPDGLVEETTRTPSLLFGGPSRKTRRWYSKLLRGQYEEVPQDRKFDDCVLLRGQVYRDFEEYGY